MYYIILSLSISEKTNTVLQNIYRPPVIKGELENISDGLYSILPLADGREALRVDPNLIAKVSEEADIHALDYLFDGAINTTTDEAMKTYLEQNKVELQEAIKFNLGNVMRPWELIKLTPWGQPYPNPMGYHTYEQMVAQGFIVELTI